MSNLVSTSTRRLTLLIVGASLGAVGWGAVLPFLYADIADARGLGSTVAAMTFTAFALGALLAAPVAGRLADRARPAIVATVARFGMIAAIVGLMFARDAAAVWVLALAYGASLAVVQPSVSVLVLALTPADKRRDAFAWQFIGQNLALALGGFVGGFIVDLTTPTGSRPAYAFAAIASLASAVLVWVVSRSVQTATVDVDEPADDLGYRAVLRAPGIRMLLGVTALLTLACYAQFDSGLPAYALSVLAVHPTVLGTAVAVNAVLVSALTAPVISRTRRIAPTTLLATCALIWIGVWVVLGLPMLDHSWGATLVVAGYGLFSVGETMLAPVLSPLAAALAPSGATGRTLAAVSGAQTLATAIGPGISGLLLGLGVPAGFIGLQIACCIVAAVGAHRLGRAVTRPVHRDEVALAH